MQAGTAAATTRRRFGGRVGAVVFSGAVVLALAVAPAGALAKGGGSGSPTPAWIQLSSVGGAAPTVHPMLGNTVAFATGYPSTTKTPWVSLICRQGSDVVYAEGNSPTAEFTLGGASSTWLTVGGSATCTAELGSIVWKGGKEYYTALASTSFSAN